MATFYQAVALRKHRGRKTTWRGKLVADPARALKQAQRWRMREPLLHEYYVATVPGDKRISIEDLEDFLSGKPK